MATIGENLQTIIDIKADIKTAIENKGVEVGDASFGSYAEKINEIEISSIFDFSKIGYHVSEDYPTLYNDLMYSKLLYDTWENSNKQYVGDLYKDDVNLVYAPKIDISNDVSMYRMFWGCSNLINVPLYDTSNIISMYGTFYNCTSLTSVPQFDTSSVEIMDITFAGCTSLNSIPLFDASKVDKTLDVLRGCISLKNVGGFTNLGKGFLEPIAQRTLDLRACLLLTYDSCLNIFNTIYNMNLNTNVTTQPGIIFHTDVFNLLSAEDIAIATNKGWTVQSA